MQNRISSRSTLRLLATAVLAAALLLGAAACGSDADDGGAASTDDRSESPAGGPDDGDPGTDDGVGTDGGEELPEDWPTDLLPVPDGFDVVSAQSAGSLSLIALSGPSSTSAADILADWADRLEAGEFDVGERSDTAVLAERTDDSGLTMMVDASEIDFGADEITQLSVTVRRFGG